jgi:hypothetical protein
MLLWVTHRQVKPYDELGRLPLAVKAKLLKDEVLGISLYTGPMFYKYNAVSTCCAWCKRGHAGRRADK